MKNMNILGNIYASNKPLNFLLDRIALLLAHY